MDINVKVISKKFIGKRATSQENDISLEMAFKLAAHFTATSLELAFILAIMVTAFVCFWAK